MSWRAWRPTLVIVKRMPGIPLAGGGAQEAARAAAGQAWHGLV